MTIEHEVLPEQNDGETTSEYVSRLTVLELQQYRTEVLINPPESSPKRALGNVYRSVEYRNYRRSLRIQLIDDELTERRA